MISFVIPAYNEVECIPWCIGSIKAEAHGVPHEIIVVDNASTDETARMAMACGATVISEPVKGITRARQAGLKTAKYEIVAFIDADTMIPTGWLDYAFKAMNKTNVVAVSGPVVYRDLALPKRVLTASFYTIAKAAHWLLPMIQGGNFVLDGPVFLWAGGFDTSIDFYGEDTSTAVRLSKLGLIEFDLNMFCFSSARRFKKEGLFRTGVRYILNYLWIWAWGKPFTGHYQDVRSK